MIRISEARLRDATAKARKIHARPARFCGPGVKMCRPWLQSGTPRAPWYSGYAHLGAGLTVGLSSLAAGLAIGIVGDAGVRANAQQPRLFVGMILILIFAEAALLVAKDQPLLDLLGLLGPTRYSPPGTRGGKRTPHPGQMWDKRRAPRARGQGTSKPGPGMRLVLEQG